MTDAKTPKPITLGEFKPLLAGTSLARIGTAALPGKYTVAEIAKAAGLREGPGRAHRLRHGLGRAHGIGHNRDEAGVVTIVLPDGVPAEALVAGEAKAAGKPVAKKKPARTVAATAAHRRGNSEPENAGSPAGFRRPFHVAFMLHGPAANVCKMAGILAICCKGLRHEKGRA
jgi:hypothetical protein